MRLNSRAGERDRVGVGFELLELAGGPRAEDRGRAEQRLRRREIGDGDLARSRCRAPASRRLRPTAAAASCRAARRSVTRDGAFGAATRRAPRPRRRRARPSADGDVGHAAAEIRRAVGRDRHQRHARRLLARRAIAGVFGIGSHTNVTRVLPFSPRDVPIQVRTTLRARRRGQPRRAPSRPAWAAPASAAPARAPLCSAVSAQ